MNAVVHRSAFRAATLCVVACAAVAANPQLAGAADYFWTGTGTTGGSGNWSTLTNWSTVVSTTTPRPLTVPTVADDVYFSITGGTSAATVTLTADAFARSITQSTMTGNLSLAGNGGATDRTLTIGSGGITSTVTNNIFQIGANGSNRVNVRLDGSQRWSAVNWIGGSYLVAYNQISRAAGDTISRTLALDIGTTFQQNITLGDVRDGGTSGSLSLWQTGLGTLTFGTSVGGVTGSSSYTGRTTISQGYLTLAAGNLPTSGTLALRGGNISLQPGSWALPNMVVETGVTAVGYSTSGTANLGTISRTGGVVRFSNASTGSTAYVISNANNSAGILGAWAMVGNNDWATVSSGTLAVATRTTVTESGLTSINGLYSLGAATLTASRSAYVIGSTDGFGKDISLGSGANDLTVSGFSTTNGVWNFSRGAGSTGRLVIGQDNELIFGGNAYSIAVPIVDGAAAGRVTFWSVGSEGNMPATLSGSSSYSGGTVLAHANPQRLNINNPSAIGTGTLWINPTTLSRAGNVLGNTSGAPITLSTNNAQSWDGNFQFSGPSDLNMGTGTVSLGATPNAARTVRVNAATLTIGGRIVDGSHPDLPTTGLTVSGSALGRLLLTGSNSYTGPTTVSGGILQFATRRAIYGGDAAKWTAANLITGSGGVMALDVGTTGEFTAADLDTFKALGTGTSGFLPGSFLGIDTTSVASGTFTYSSTIANTNGGANAFGIAKIGGGTLVLSGNNTMTGGVSVRGGTLLLTAANQMGTGPISLFSGTLSTSSDAFMNGTASPLTFAGGALQITGTDVTSLATGRTTTFTAASPVIFDITSAANTFEVSQVLNQTTGNLVKLGAGTLNLTSANTYTGATVIGSSGGPTGGTLRLSNAGRISTGTTATIFAGTLDTNGLNQTIGGTLTLGGGAAATTAGVTTSTGTLTLGGNVTFDATNNPGGASMAGNVNLNNANRTFTVGDSFGAAADLTISAAIVGGGASGALTKAGVGTLVLSGSNSYAGTTTVNSSGGVLQFANKNALYGGTTASWTRTNITVNSGATLAVNVGDSGDLFTDANVATLLTGIGGTITNNGLRAGSNIGFDTTNATSGTFTLGTVVANTLGTGSGAVGLVKLGAGTLVVQGANTFTGTTFIGTLGGGNAGTLRLASTGSISGIATVFGGTLDFDGNSRTLTALNLGGGGAGSAASVLTGSGTLSLNGNAAFDATNNPDGATISGNVLIMGSAARTLTVGDSFGAAADLTITALLSGTHASAGLTKAGNGALVLAAANSYQGKTTVQAGAVEFSSIANVGGGASNFGAPTSPGNGTIDLGSGSTAGTLRYTGTGHSSDRVINLAGTTGGATLDASGSGPLVLTAANTAAAGTKTFTLTGTSTADNAIGVIAGAGVSVDKTGPGTWRLTGASSYDGQFRALDGTIVVAATVGSQGGSPFGTGSNTVIGSSVPGATGTAALLVEGGGIEAGQVKIERDFSVAPLGGGASQVVVLGATGTGVAYLGTSSTEIRLGRSVTLQASGSVTASFGGKWTDGSGNDNPAVAYTIGSAGNAGVVELFNTLSGSATGVSIVNGTARAVLNDRISNPATPVTIGSTIGAATLDISDPSGFSTISQRLGNLTFDGNSGSITSTSGNGTLRLWSGSTASVTVTGTNHSIASAVALDVASSFTVNPGGRLGITSVISGSSGGSLTKTGLGILELSNANTYPGPTIISAGTLALGAAGSFANSSTVTVGDADSSGAVLDLTAKSGGFAFGPAQTLEGGGTVKLASSGTLTVGGLFSPGNSPGLFTYDGGTTLLSGTTLMEIWGTSRATAPSHASGFYDAVNVINGGILNFNGGMLELTFSQLFDSGTEFNLFSTFNAASLAGNFAGVSVTGSFYSGLTWSPTGNIWRSSETGGQSLEFNASTGTLVIVVPEPAAIALAAIGIAAAAWAAKRRRS